MKKRWITKLLLFALLFSIISVRAFTYDNPNIPHLIKTTTSSSTNYSSVNVNNSQYLQGYTPTTLKDWIQGYFNNVYASYQFTNNNFNGTGNFETTGRGSFTGLYEGINYNAGKGIYSGNNRIESTRDIGSPFLAVGRINNILLQSEVLNLNTAWIKKDIKTVFADKVMSPRYTLVAENISCNFTVGTLTQNTNNVSLGNWTFSIYAKGILGGSNDYIFGLKINTTAEDTQVINFTANGEWNRYSITEDFYTAHINKTVTIFIYKDSKNISLWGAQLNYGLTPTPYYTTTTAFTAEQSYFYSVNAIVSAAGFSGTTGSFSTYAYAPYYSPYSATGYLDFRLRTNTLGWKFTNTTGTAIVNITGDGTIQASNLTLNKFLTLKNTTINGNCNGNLNYTFATNQTGIYFCNGSMWRKLAFEY